MQAATVRPVKEPKMQTVKRIFAVLAIAGLLAAGTGCELDIVLGGSAPGVPIIRDHYYDSYDVVVIEDCYYDDYYDYYYYGF